MSSDIIERKIHEIRERADDIQQKAFWSLMVLILVFLSFFLVPLLMLYGNVSPFQFQDELISGWPSSLFIVSIFLVSTAIYFTSLLRKPKFTALYINKENRAVHTTDDVPKSQKAGLVTPIRVFSLGYLPLVTAFSLLSGNFSLLAFLCLLWVPAYFLLKRRNWTPAVVFSLVYFVAVTAFWAHFFLSSAEVQVFASGAFLFGQLLSYVPLIPAYFVFRRQQWTQAVVFRVTFLTLVTLMWVFQLLPTPDLSFTSFYPWVGFLIALSYVPAFTTRLLFRSQNSTDSLYTVPFFYGVYLSAVLVLITRYVAGVLVSPRNVFPPELAPLYESWFVFLLLMFLSFLLGNHVLSSAKYRTEERSAPLLQERSVTDGVAIFPKSIQVGRSENLMIDFDLSKYACESATAHAGECCRLEAELQAAGIAVDGEKRLRLCADSPLSTGLWNCYFPNIGHNVVNIILSEVNLPSNEPRSMLDNAHDVIFVHTIDVKVYGLFAGSNLALLTLIISSFAAIATFISSSTSWKSLLYPAANNSTANVTANATVHVSGAMLLPLILSAMQILANGVHALVH